MRTRVTILMKGMATLFGALLIAPMAIAQCGLQTPPVEQSFDNNTMPPGCWTNQQGWELGQQGDPGWGAGDPAEHTGNGGYFAFVDFSDWSDAQFASDYIDVSGMTNQPEVVYWFFSNNEDNPGDNNTLELQAWDGSSWQVVKSHAQDDPNWVKDTAVLNNNFIFNDSIRIRFRAHETTSGSSYLNDILIDDIQIRELPSCYDPANLSANDLNSDSVELSWTSNSSGTEWEVEYGPAGFTPGNGDTVLFTNNPDTVTGLSAMNTPAVDFYLREICGPGDTSVRIGPANATLPCPPAYTAPFLEDFDAQPWTPGEPGNISNCWDRDLGDYPWEVNSGQTSSSNNGPDGDFPGHGGGNYMFTEASSANSGDITGLRTPWIDVSTLNNPQLRFFYHFYLNNDPGRFAVAIDSGAGWTEIDTILQETHSAHSDPWSERILPLSDYSGDTIRVKFEVEYGGTYSDYAIDHVEIREEPSCPKPSGLSVGAMTGDTAIISWTSNASGSEWEIEYGSPGFTQGNGTTELLTSNPDTIGGLTPDTDYEFYIREICGPGDTSEWTLQSTAYSSPCAADTVPYLEEFDNSPWVDGSPGTIDQCWDREQNDFPWEVGSGQTPSSPNGPDGDYPGHGGGNYMFTEGSSSSGEGILTSPLIDLANFNVAELRFFYHFFLNDDVGEFYVEVDDGTGWTTLDSIKTQTHHDESDPWTEWTVPLHGYENQTVQIRFRAVSGGTYSDYAIDHVQIRELAPNDVGVTQLIEPTDAGCSGSFDPKTPITIEVENVGSQAQDTIPVAYTIDGGVPVEDTLFNTVQPGGVDTFSFDSTGALAISDDYDLSVYTEHSQDTVPGNDTLDLTLTNGGDELSPSTNTPMTIPEDDETREDHLYACGADERVYECGKIFQVTIDSLTHEDALDELDIQLISPSGTVLDLWMQLGGSSDQTMEGLTFADTATQNVTNSTGDPHTGYYLPEDPQGFSKFIGDSLNGQWTLRIFNDDFSTGDSAILHGWNMQVLDPDRPQPDLGSNDTICKNEGTLLDPGQDPDWTYMWDNNSTDSVQHVSGEFLDIGETYSYSVSVTNTDPFNRCSNSDSVELYVEDCDITSVEEERQNASFDIEIRPNPASDRLSIESEGSDERFRYELLDIQGRTLKSGSADSQQRSTLDVSDLSQGVYILKGYRKSNEEELFQEKVIVE